MNLSEFQQATRKTAVYPSVVKVEYPALGLAGEAGELANKLKKVLRGDITYEERREGLIDELGDCYWYAAAFASDAGIDLGMLEPVHQCTCHAPKTLTHAVRLLMYAAGNICNDLTGHVEYRCGRLLLALSNVAGFLGVSVEVVCQRNIDKLTARLAAGTIRGEGDNR